MQDQTVETIVLAVGLVLLLGGIIGIAIRDGRANARSRREHERQRSAREAARR